MTSKKHLCVTPFPIFILNEFHQLLINASAKWEEEPTSRAELDAYIISFVKYNKEELAQYCMLALKEPEWVTKEKFLLLAQ